MTTKIDMHSHTRGSDGTGSPEQIVEWAKRAQLGALCLTDHHTNNAKSNRAVHEVAAALDAAGILPIVGCEYSTAQGHLLVYGVDVPKDSWGMYPRMQDVIDDVRGRGGACVAPHPYKGYRRSLQNDVFQIKGLSALEINGQCAVRDARLGLNTKAARAAELMGLPLTGGSDAHDPRYIGTCFTLFEDTIRDEAAFLEALRRGRFAGQANRHKVRRLQADWRIVKTPVSRRSTLDQKWGSRFFDMSF